MMEDDVREQKGQKYVVTARLETASLNNSISPWSLTV